MSRALRLTLIAVAVPIILWMLVGAVFALDRATGSGQVLGRVSIDDVEVGGLPEAEAREAIAALHERLANEPIPVTVQDTEFLLIPREVGFRIDEEALLERAMTEGRQGGLFTQMGQWTSMTFGGASRTIDSAGMYSRETLDAMLKLWERSAIADPPAEGGIVVVAGTVEPVYPTAGTGIDIDATIDLIEAEIFGDRRPVTALTEYRVPVLTNSDVDRAVTRAESLVSGSVTLSKILPSASVTFPRTVLQAAIASRVIGTPEDPAIDLFFQVGSLVQYIAPIRDTIETPPQDAQIVIRPDDVPMILPGSNAALVDDAQLPRAVMDAATSVTRSAPLPMREGAEPEFTTEDAEGLGIKGLLYEATTFFQAGGAESNRNRVINIQTMADEIDGEIVLPGEEFSVNERIGQRTLEKGYRRAGAIIGPVIYCCDHPANIGGGVSQFATTLYNAVFWSGLEDIDHTPHSLYISRYPAVREATLGFPSPDLVFRNNTEHAILIKTEHTETSVTVKFFGDNGGITVESELSDRSNPTEPGVYYEPDPTVPPDTEEEREEGSPGFTQSVTRIIYNADGTEQSRQTWTHRYHPWPTMIAVHPCKLPSDHIDYDGSIPCPVEVPANLVGMSLNEAITALNSIGITLRQGDEVVVGSPEQHGRVQSHDPSGGTWLDPGEIVTVRLGRYDDDGGD